MFDLILGTQTMDELGIILDFKHKMITIDELNCQWYPLKICLNLDTKH